MMQKMQNFTLTLLVPGFTAWRRREQRSEPTTVPAVRAIAYRTAFLFNGAARHF
jgi:hypothetical protein